MDLAVPVDQVDPAGVDADLAVPADADPVDPADVDPVDPADVAPAVAAVDLAAPIRARTCMRT